ncbi:hypothetical protein [Mycolicibacterium setense]|uniref:hypothetical protein n=1 Tax=Mycolicibacterium setense TaxID=431269 RepID=UPI000AC86192|nr:hypothetical protein [Mycolicibacterium setense]
MSPLPPEHRRHRWARRAETTLTWIGYTADAAAGVSVLSGWAQGSAVATVVAATANAGSRVAQWWTTREPPAKRSRG